MLCKGALILSNLEQGLSFAFIKKSNLLETKIENGKEIVLKRVIEIDVYVKVSEVKGSVDFHVKNFSRKELNEFSTNFRNDLASHYKDGIFKDKEGNKISFKFNIIPFGGNENAVQEFREYLRTEEVGVLKDKEDITLVVYQISWF